MKIDTIGIVGQGFVGSAVREGMQNFVSVDAYDKDPAKNSTVENLETLVKKNDIIFVCLPTPMRRTGQCDLSIVDKVIHQIDEIAGKLKVEKIAVVKSTIPPGTTKNLNNEVSNIQVVFNPEFLTEANHIEDFKNQTRIILGGPRPATTVVKTLFKKAFPSVPIIKTGSNTAEMVKYFINCFLATKVTFANEMYFISQELDIDFDKVTEYALYDQRIGRSHLAVPGPDGDFGFGGHCFPKDLGAMIYLAETIGKDTTLLEAVKSKNNMLRSARDWEDMIGRAVSED